MFEEFRDLSMPRVRVPILRKTAGIHYAVNSDGVELPIVDLTHPSFALSRTREEQDALRASFIAEQEKYARLPGWLRRFLTRLYLRRSLLGRGLLDAHGAFLSGMNTY